MKLLKNIASTTEFCTIGCTGLLWFPLCQITVPGASTLGMTAGINPPKIANGEKIENSEDKKEDWKMVKIKRRLKTVKIKKKIESSQDKKEN